MVQICRLGQAKEHLQHPLDRGGRAQVGGADDQVRSARRVVHDAGEMIGGRRVLSREDRIVEVSATARKAFAGVFGPVRQAGAFQRLARVEPPAVGSGSASPGVMGQASAGARIVRGRPMWRFERGGDVRPGAEARIDQPRFAKPVERASISITALRLHQHRLVPLESEPAQILEDSVDELGPAASWVEVLDPDEEFIARLARQRRAVSVAEMQPSGRRWSETRDLHARPP